MRAEHSTAESPGPQNRGAMEGTVPCPGESQCGQPQETITLVAHSDPEEEEEEELITITTQATPALCQTQGRMVVQTPPGAPGILVTDITSASVCVRDPASLKNGAASCLSRVTVSTTHASDTGPPRHTTTTTSSTSYVPAIPPAKYSAPLRQPRGVLATEKRHTKLQGTTPIHATTRRAVSHPSGTTKGTGGVLGSSQRSEHRAADTPHTAVFGLKTTTLIPARQPEEHLGHCGSTSTPAQHLLNGGAVVRCASPSVALSTPSTPCTFCGSMVDTGDTSTHLYLQDPLPHSLLDPLTLLQCLGVAPLSGATTTLAASQAVLCQECHALLREGDEAYHSLMQIMAAMRRRWATVTTPTAATAHAARKVRPILPKPVVQQGTAAPCGLCGAASQDWRVHASTQHRLSPRWKSPRLLAALKTCVAEELRQGSGQRGARCCPACTRSFTQQEEFVEHLRRHHEVTVDEGLPACLDGANGAGQDTAEQQGEGKAACLVLEDKVERVMEDKQEEAEEEQLLEDEKVVEEGVMEEELVVREEGLLVDEKVKEEDTLEQESVKQEQQQGVRTDSLPGQQELGRAVDKYPGRPVGGAVRCRGGTWRCRVCATVFSSQNDHDLHKAAAHPGSVRAGRGRTWPVVPGSSPGQGAETRGGQQDAAACQEGTIIILEGDGHGGVTHRRLQPAGTPEPQQTAPPPSDGAPGCTCAICEEVFGDRLSLVRHRRAAHPGPGDERGGEGVVLVECPLCSRRLAGLPALRHHLARVHHHSAHPPLHHRCRLCLCQCLSRSQLERHMRERHGAPPPPPPVRCGRCGKTYSARYIDSHVANMHGDTGRFPCAFCPMRFGARAGLRAHVSLEHANTTWACQECPLQFAKYHQLRQHRLYVHSRAEHRCAECPRSFKRRCDLTEHTKRRHQERPPRECSFCPKVYSDRKRLRLHLMRKHGVAWEDTLAQGYARRQRENNCLRRRQQQQPPHSPQPTPHQEEQQVPRGGDGVLEEQREYRVVQLSEAPPLADTISYIILEEA